MTKTQEAIRQKIIGKISYSDLRKEHAKLLGRFIKISPESHNPNNTLKDRVAFLNWVKSLDPWHVTANNPETLK